MSVIRTNDLRRLKRSNTSSPYSRSRTPAQGSNSLGSIWNFSRFFSFLAPFLNPSDEPSDENLSFNTIDDDTAEAIPSSPPVIAPDPKQLITPPRLPPPSNHGNEQSAEVTSRLPLLFNAQDRASLSPHQSKTMDMVSQYCADRLKEGRELTDLEVNGLMNLIQKAEDGEVAQQVFRFSATPSTPARSPPPVASFVLATPERGMSNSTRSLPSIKNNVSGPSDSPRKALARNPNGSLIWTGAGSARRGGKPSSRSSSPLKTSLRITPLSDTKRRRVGEDKDFSTAEPSGSQTELYATHTSTQTTSQTPSTRPLSKLPPLPLRPTITPKNQPAIPSPLRQAYTRTPSTPGSPSSSTSVDVPSPTPLQKRGTSRAADVLTEIIEKATPPPKPDLSNPYQTASPVKFQGKPKEKKKFIDKKGKGKETEKTETDKPVEKKEEQKEAIPSPKAIIEATTPKGAKRARPPPNLTKETTSASPIKITPFNNNRIFGVNGKPPTPTPIEVEEIDDDAEQSPSPPKKQKRSAPVMIEEVDDSDVPTNTNGKNALYIQPTEIVESGDNTQPGYSSSVNGASNSSSGSSSTTLGNSNGIVSFMSTSSTSTAFSSQHFGNRAKSSAPKEPSKLRTSFVVEDDDAATEQPTDTPSAFRAPQTESTAMKSTDDATSALASEKDATTSMTPIIVSSVNSLAETKVNGILPKESTSQKDNTLLKDNTPRKDSTPQKDVTPQKDGTSQEDGTSQKVEKDLKTIALEAPASSLPVYSFTISSSEANDDLEKHAKERDLAMRTPIDSLPKFTFLIITAEFPKPAPASKAFDWAAAGVKPPTSVSEGKWKCSECNLLNDEAAKDKCQICDASRPQPTSSIKAPVKGFDWAAAGLKAPETKSGGIWKCAECTLDNKNPASKQCEYCDHPRAV